MMRISLEGVTCGDADTIARITPSNEALIINARDDDVLITEVSTAELAMFEDWTNPVLAP